MSKLNIIIYTLDNCHYCIMAKKLLDRKNMIYSEINMTDKKEERKALIQKANGNKTLPQIFIDDQYIGGYSDLIKFYEQ